MRVFVTGATGFIGSQLVPELIAAGHQVLGLTRSEQGAAALAAAGATPHRGNLEDPASLQAGAAASDAVIHLAFDHDFTKWAENCEKERHAIAAIGETLQGTNRPFIVTSGTAAARTPGRLTTEDDEPNSPIPRVASENAAHALLGQGVQIIIMRLPQVHDPLKQGLITPAIAIAREKSVSAYVGEGDNRWPAAHVSDVARLYRLALENGTPGARYNAVAEEGVAFRDIAQAIGNGLNLPVISIPPEKAEEHFGWLGIFAAFDIPASSALTRQRLNWHPMGPTMLADLGEGRF